MKKLFSQYCAFTILVALISGCSAHTSTPFIEIAAELAAADPIFADHLARRAESLHARTAPFGQTELLGSVVYLQIELPSGVTLDGEWLDGLLDITTPISFVSVGWTREGYVVKTNLVVVDDPRKPPLGDGDMPLAFPHPLMDFEMVFSRDQPAQRPLDWFDQLLPTVEQFSRYAKSWRTVGSSWGGSTVHLVYMARGKKTIWFGGVNFDVELFGSDVQSDGVPLVATNLLLALEGLTWVSRNPLDICTQSTGEKPN